MNKQLDPTEIVLQELNEVALKLVRSNKTIKESGLDHTTDGAKEMIETLDDHSISLSEVLLKLEQTL